MDTYSLNLLAEGQRNAAAGAPLPRLDVVNGDAVNQWVELQKAYVGLRGATAGPNRTAIPKTSHADVLQLATLWTRELGKVTPRSPFEGTEHERWKACADQVEERGDKDKGSEVYPDNQRFWECTKRLAIYLQSRKVVPSRWQLVTESVTEAIAEVPQVVGRASRAAAETAAGVLADPARLAAVLLGAAVLLPPIVRAWRAS